MILFNTFFGGTFTIYLLFLTPIPVSFLQPGELLSYDAGERWPDDPSGHRVLGDGAEVQVDVPRVLVHLLELVPVGPVQLLRPPGPGGGQRLEAARPPVLAVGGEAVVAAALDVQGQEVLAKVLAAAGSSKIQWRFQNFF